jgi:hypothetical protein
VTHRAIRAAIVQSNRCHWFININTLTWRAKPHRSAPTYVFPTAGSIALERLFDPIREILFEQEEQGAERVKGSLFLCTLLKSSYFWFKFPEILPPLAHRDRVGCCRSTPAGRGLFADEEPRPSIVQPRSAKRVSHAGRAGRHVYDQLRPSDAGSSGNLAAESSVLATWRSPTQRSRSTVRMPPDS